ncbi:hypothetical protein BXZ70DRAFT_769478 [Cristinia sonorae]|uniref:Neutral metalloproteinase n=1 Tax=Cristinia sonorae TaxID=1940300 RepID=A0A8K0XS59_9AGAR|nr:hypothetical protein BXZ70DRAFT_769478 [Cristinia sonorae]
MSSNTLNDRTHVAHCSAIPPYILANIVNHPDAPETAKVHARKALLLTQDYHQRRNEFIAQQLIANQAGSLITQDKVAAPKRLNRKIYSASNTKILDHTLLRSESDAATSDVAENEAYDGFGSTFKFYSDIFDRNSINDNGMTLNGTVHFDQNYSNAYWDGAQMIFGDGDGVYFNRFTASLDVIGHELTHGVTQYTANLIYQDQSGALNESMSDVFGIMVKQYKLGETAAQSDWLIGAELFTTKVKGKALRSMKDPGSAFDDPVLGKDEQVATYSEVLAKPFAKDDDHGGVHIYSGVPNRAFYLVATNLGGYSWDRAGRIWWGVLTGGKLKHTANFHDFAQLTCVQAEKLYGASVKEVVEKAWKDVGVEVDTQLKTVSGKWVGSQAGSHLEITFDVSGETLTGSGLITLDGKTTAFNIINGYYGTADKHLRFDAKYESTVASNAKFIGTMSPDADAITGTWEKAAVPDNSALYGLFNLTKAF